MEPTTVRGECCYEPNALISSKKIPGQIRSRHAADFCDHEPDPFHDAGKVRQVSALARNDEALCGDSLARRNVNQSFRRGGNLAWLFFGKNVRYWTLRHVWRRGEGGVKRPRYRNTVRHSTKTNVWRFVMLPKWGEGASYFNTISNSISNSSLSPLHLIYISLLYRLHLISILFPQHIQSSLSHIYIISVASP